MYQSIAYTKVPKNLINPFFTSVRINEAVIPVI